MMQRPGYLREFLEFWTPRPEVNKIWFSMFTPQQGATGAEILSSTQRAAAVEELLCLRKLFPKLDMTEGAIREFLSPPASPGECIFAQTTEIISADLKTRVAPCQFGGIPDCSQCGCMASMGLAAVGHHRLGGVVSVGSIFRASLAVGERTRAFRRMQAMRRTQTGPRDPQPQSARESTPVA
jgi:hypothetical protein